MSAAGKQRSIPSAARPRRDMRRRERKSRFFVLVVDDERVISQINQLACTCIEITRDADLNRTEAASHPCVPAQLPMQDRLTRRQFEIALGVSRGLSNKDIGRELGISHLTVRNHLSLILLTLGLADRQELARLLHLDLFRLA
ncbi:MAG: response regulator transcription factor [Sphingomonadales bacterium]|nr:response regulator transcription factor [Sphingomonadales bacterium]